MIKKAAEFAARAHEGKVRKGSRIPYIVHPLEAAAIVAGLTEDPEVISAAILHDVIEDTEVTYEILEEEFGKRVADLVAEESEDKSKTWQQRKQATVNRLASASREVKLICIGDKLSNLRSTAADYLLKGEDVWLKFKEKDKGKHEWYYRSVLEALSEFKGETAYAEYAMLMNRLFSHEQPEKGRV